MEKVIITGQQIGLLGGPLYTTYKVLGAIFHARRLGAKALYWLETNDADFNEINHIEYIDARGDSRQLTWDIDSKGYSCGLITVDEMLPALLDTYFASIQQTEFTKTLKEMAMDCYQPRISLAEASMQLAHELYGHLGIQLFDPAEKAFREFSRGILLREAQDTPPGQQCNLFCMRGKRREALFKETGARGSSGGTFRLRDGTNLDYAELSQHALVPNVKTRSLCQDAYFHTHTYIAGPGEVQYLSQLDPIYASHGIKKASVQPRMSLTLLEPKIQRLLRKYNISLDDVQQMDKAHLVQSELAKHSGFDINKTRELVEEYTTSYLDRLKATGLDTIKLGRLLHTELKQAIGQKRAQEKEKNNKLIENISYLSEHLRPFGKKQERVFNIFYYMNLFGGKVFIDQLLENYDPEREILAVPIKSG